MTLSTTYCVHWCVFALPMSAWVLRWMVSDFLERLSGEWRVYRRCWVCSKDQLSQSFTVRSGVWCSWWGSQRSAWSYCFMLFITVCFSLSMLPSWCLNDVPSALLSPGPVICCTLAPWGSLAFTTYGFPSLRLKQVRQQSLITAQLLNQVTNSLGPGTDRCWVPALPGKQNLLLSGFGQKSHLLSWHN